MALFGFGKKKEEKAAPSCGCSGGCAPAQEESRPVKVLGGGCARCNELEASVLAAMQELGMEPVVEHVTDFVKIASYGVMATPALVIDGKVVSSGKVLSSKEAAKLLKEAQGV